MSFRIGFRRRPGWELAAVARQKQDRFHWRRLMGMNHWALILMTEEKGGQR